MTSLVQRLARAAVWTFRRDAEGGPGRFQEQYQQMCGLLERVSLQDLHLDPRLLVDRGLYNPSRDGAPVTYMQIYEDQDVTICVFILKRGVRLPLHDHPDMYGLLKVVHGVVSVQSYSLSEDGEGARMVPGAVVSAIKHPVVEVGVEGTACRLQPCDHNIHEIRSLDGPAAFLDILSPPYGEDTRTGHDRDCHYYQEVAPSLAPSLAAPNSVLLLSIPTPGDFWCDQAEYRGPPIILNSDRRPS